MQWNRWTILALTLAVIFLLVGATYIIVETTKPQQAPNTIVYKYPEKEVNISNDSPLARNRAEAKEVKK